MEPRHFVKTPYPSGRYADQYGTRYHVREVEAGRTIHSPYAPQPAENLEAFLIANALHEWHPEL